MQKKMKFWSIVLLTINSIIGTGIFLSPGGVARMVGSIAPYIYIAAAIFTIFLAITFASAAKYVTKSGAAYAYSKSAFGEGVGFYVGITRVVAASIAWGVVATAVVRSIYKIFGVETNTTTITIGFLILMALLLIINIFGTRFLTIISDLSTIGKLSALIITILLGIFIVLKTGEIHINEIDTLTNSDGKLIVGQLNSSVFVLAVVTAFYAFTGFESIASGSQDMENPEKNLPRAIPLAIIIIALIYFGIILISMSIDPVAIATSTNPVVLADVFTNEIIKKIIIVGAIISMFGINVAASFHTPRVFEAMANENHVPKVFAKRLENGVPIFAFILTGAVAIIIPMAFGYSMGDIIIISSISRFVQFIVVPLSVIVFFYGKSKEKVLQADKNFITDVIFPIISVILTVVLLAKFDWVGKFSNVVDGVREVNFYAVTAMIVGYLILPLFLYVYKIISLDKIK